MGYSRVFRTCLFFLALTLGLHAQSFTPANSTNAKDFLGNWQGSFHGKVFVTLVITGDAHKLSGTVSKADVELNEAGELTKAEANDGYDTIASAQVNGNRLRITAKSTDGSEDSIDWEIVLVGANQGELHPIVPADVPRPKPWKLTKVPHS
jgi:hypothetical protein